MYNEPEEDADFGTKERQQDVKGFA